ncbi:nicotinate (nicotinamide) nucleotide adenylyltransferase [Lutimonas zeaxanthinifaciens]|uniref:nicotinate (nicotinamide) nucleotide adenylyltransferase n=1 Tax=Lutimonas zeaxanthinifaciens TaxID=3060215 RepID=UPI00265C9794|nr:nicotinate (nicotinamide) nucleotide adenylyltransferase [Lutimonas sp. YSD2104]WKK66076.1 nicotinate (nicotinamide) nucleotide adenylyltransferase [Lutimonas sp. YSD2104]
MKIGLFFGSFNPVHVGHLIIANHIVENSDLDEVWMVVTPHNPLKKKQSLLDDHHRYQLVLEATEDYPKIKPSNIEFGLPQPNYTINTLIYLGEKYPKHHFNLIMGRDNLNSFKKWKNYDRILEYHDLYVYPRVTASSTIPELINHERVHLIDAPIVEISSTAIRKAIKEGKNIRPLMPYRAWSYLDEMNFYK